MTTKWGACNTSTGKIWLNLQLAKKPIECLEYVILHELIHLKVRNHGPEFVTEMNRYMQNWREIRNQLNESKLDYLAPTE
jgi:predicted metal-dependent hydrolase